MEKQQHAGTKNLVHFKKGVSGNPKGRPRNGIRQVNDELAAQGYVLATRQDIINSYTSLIGLPLSEIAKLAADAEKPMLTRIVAKAIASPKGFDIVERILDRVIGKPTQRQEITGEGGGPLKVEDAAVQKALDSALAEFRKPKA